MTEKWVAPLTEEGYARANAAFRQTWSGDRPDILQFLEERLPAVLAGKTDLALLSVGAGTGLFDEQAIYLVQRITGQSALDYVVVEPNAAQNQEFAAMTRKEALKDVRFKMMPLRAEDFRPDRAFDLIFYIHSIYHMPGSQEALIRDSVAMLKPHGLLILAVASEECTMAKLMQQFFGIIDYQAVGDTIFGVNQLKQVLERNHLSYTYHPLPQSGVDVTECFRDGSEAGQDLLNFLLQVDTQRLPQEIRQQALAYLKENAAAQPGGRFVVPHWSGVFVLPRTASV
ncbi:MAG: class I SAM-dependent methyltransferase [Chloroflexaceae bacterium]|nr:class I SAM-dependent methyltransferase [Chloroflexaceae bacterium]